MGGIVFFCGVDGASAGFDPSVTLDGNLDPSTSLSVCLVNGESV